MLTAELVRARRKDGELRVTLLDDKSSARALALAEALLPIARDHVGRSRDELEEALDQVESAARDRVLLAGLRKLIEDRCEFDTPADLSPDELRREVFTRAAAAWRASGDGVSMENRFDRQAVLSEIAQARGVDIAQLERYLYADLRGAQLLTSVAAISPRALIDGYDTAQVQAVLLRAVRVTAEVHCASAGAYRALFHKLKFLRLLTVITPQPDGYRLDIDGPFSLFESVTKYGIQLALALPAIKACDFHRLKADVRWGKERIPLVFRLEGEGAPDLGIPAPGSDSDTPLPDDVAAFVRGFRSLDTPWRLTVAPAILHVPGAGVCVPDLLFQRADTGQRVYLEVMGFWSRDAVFRRVELVQRGLKEPILFALSARLRVSEQVLPDDLPAALYVYKGIINPRVVVERLDLLASRAGAPKEVSGSPR